MRRDLPLRFWPIRLLPLLAALLGAAGLFVVRGPMTAVAGLLIAAAAALELLGWGEWVEQRGRALGLATLAGATACALALVVAATGDVSVDASVIARR